MPQTILQQIWEKTFQNLAEKENFESTRINEIQSAIANNTTDQLESILSKEYENQEPCN